MPETEANLPSHDAPLRPRKWTTQVNLVLALAVLLALAAILLVIWLAAAREPSPAPPDEAVHMRAAPALPGG
jgi:hypothetical protein